MYSNIKLGKLPEMPKTIKKDKKPKIVEDKGSLYKNTYKNKLKRKRENV